MARLWSFIPSCQTKGEPYIETQRTHQDENAVDADGALCSIHSSISANKQLLFDRSAMRDRLGMGAGLLRLSKQSMRRACRGTAASTSSAARSNPFAKQQLLFQRLALQYKRGVDTRLLGIPK
ncbi:MAG: hypothetical protein OXG53_16330 [Chloroflexi bacterium]|nr:hypothetical protein [Chloroflexota bacterium]